MNAPRPGRLLLVEDEPKLAAVVRDYLVADGHTVDWLAEGGPAVEQVRATRPDLLLLDVMLPGKDGLSICREVRAFSDVPIIMVTARVEEIDRLLGLELGADDYVCKPFSPRELVARVRALLRRAHPAATGETDATASSQAGSAPVLELDGERFSVRFHGVALTLTAVEFRLLEALVRARGRVLSRNQLMDAAYVDHRVVSDRTVDSHVKNLRRKLAEVRPAEDPLRSIYGMGYRLDL